MRRLPTIALGALVGLVGCADIETTPTDTGTATVSDAGADLELDNTDGSDVVAPLPIQLEVLADRASRGRPS